MAILIAQSIHNTTLLRRAAPIDDLLNLSLSCLQLEVNACPLHLGHDASRTNAGQ